MSVIEGPYRVLTTPDGIQVPWYIIPFDSDGRCQAPRTREHLLNSLRTGGFTHVFLFSHGWNNDWEDASERYADFAAGYSTLRHEQGAAMPAGYKPLLIGVFWPSTSLVLPWERAPRFAGGTAAVGAAAFAADLHRSIAELAADVPRGSIERFYALANADALDAEGVRELASLLAPTLGADDEVSGANGNAADLADAWMAGARALAASARSESIGDTADESFGTAGPVPGAPQPAGILSSLDPRHALRMATVWKMKDRAGTIGAKGVHPLLRDVLAAGDGRVHLVGHSYGAKVVLSALAAGDLSRPVTSVLLLQPAISHLCFAVDADGNGRPGGFRSVLGRVALPIMTTFSRHDSALTKIFHLAVRRESDVGEQRIAAAGPPSRFAALGGYGPAGMDADEDTRVVIHDPGRPYRELDSGQLRVIAVNGDRTIGGHGDVSNPSTWWMLTEQARHA